MMESVTTMLMRDRHGSRPFRLMKAVVGMCPAKAWPEPVEFAVGRSIVVE